MQTKEKPLGPFPTAYGGRIIGAIVGALRLNDGVLTARTAKRFFQGRSISEHNQTEIFLALGEALVERGLVPVPPVFTQRDVSMPIIIGVAIARAASRWDRAVSRIQSRSARTVDRSATAERLLRFVVIDLSVRIFAILRLAGLEPSRPGTPLWSQENGGGRLLRDLVARAGLTREELAEQLGGSSTSSVDNWLDGKVRPTNDSIAAISEVLADHIEDLTFGELALEIQRQFTFATIVDLIEPWIGRQKVIDLSTDLVRFVWLMTEDVRQMNRPPIEEALGIELDAPSRNSRSCNRHFTQESIGLGAGRELASGSTGCDSRLGRALRKWCCPSQPHPNSRRTGAGHQGYSVGGHRQANLGGAGE